MTVTGLPAAADIAISTLLATETLSSWKVDGTENQTVVVLRFSHGQPFANDKAQRFRRKPPTQVQRDIQRAQRHRELKNACSTYLSSMPLDRREYDPCSVSDFAVNNPCTEAPDVPSSVNSDPQTEKRGEAREECTEPTDKSDCCAMEDRPQLVHFEALSKL